MNIDNCARHSVINELIPVSALGIAPVFPGTALFGTRFSPVRIIDAPNEKSLHLAPNPPTEGIDVILALTNWISYLVTSHTLPTPLVVACATACFAFYPLDIPSASCRAG